MTSNSIRALTGQIVTTTTITMKLKIQSSLGLSSTFVKRYNSFMKRDGKICMKLGK